MDNNPTELAYDLRQKYAEIVGMHLEAVAYARLEEDYPDYFKALENLFTIIRHKFKKKKEEGDDYEGDTQDKEEDKDKEKKSPIDKYKELKKVAIGFANKYQNTFLGRTQTPKEKSEIFGSLRSIEMFFYEVMDKAKMFGSTGYNEGM